MKKIYSTIFALLTTSFVMNAQLTLTQAANQPALGDIYNRKGFDSVGTVPKNTGTNQTWNFSAFTQNTITLVRTYSTTAAVPASTAYTGCNLVEDQGGGNYAFIKTSTTPTAQMELLGIQNGTVITFNFTNSAVAAVWPVAFGYNQTDNFSGSATTFLGNGPVTGTINSQATGTGSLNLPGSVNLTNILQTRITQTVNALLGTAPLGFTLNLQATNYSYYHSSSKFAVAEVEYQKQTLSSIAGPTITNSATIRINSLMIAGLKDKTIDADFQLYPNPATNALTIRLNTQSTTKSVLYILNGLGDIIQVEQLGENGTSEKEISIANLPKGIYFTKLQMGDRSIGKKLIIN